MWTSLKCFDILREERARGRENTNCLKIVALEHAFPEETEFVGVGDAKESQVCRDSNRLKRLTPRPQEGVGPDT